MRAHRQRERIGNADAGGFPSSAVAPEQGDGLGAALQQAHDGRRVMSQLGFWPFSRELQRTSILSSGTDYSLKQAARKAERPVISCKDCQESGTIEFREDGMEVPVGIAAIIDRL